MAFLPQTLFFYFRLKTFCPDKVSSHVTFIICLFPASRLKISLKSGARQITRLTSGGGGGDKSFLFAVLVLRIVILHPPTCSLLHSFLHLLPSLLPFRSFFFSFLFYHTYFIFSPPEASALIEVSSNRVEQARRARPKPHFHNHI